MAVYYIASGGSDSANGLTPATAWENLAKLNSTGPILDGDVILLEGGTTFTDARIKITTANTYTIASYGTGRAIINQGTSTQAIWLNGTTNAQIHNIEFTGNTDGLYWDLVTSGATISNCYFHDNTNNGINNDPAAGTGISGGDNWIVDCTFDTMGNDAVGIRDECQARVERCTAIDSVGDAFSAHETSQMVVSGCTITGGDDGIHHVNNTGICIVEKTYINGVGGAGVRYNPQDTQVSGQVVVRDCIIVSTGAGSGDGCVVVEGDGIVSVYNNYLENVNTGSTDTFCVDLTTAGGTQPIAVVANNIFSGSSDVNAKYLRAIGGTTLISQNNVFLEPSAATANRWTVGVTAGSFDAWKASGYDVSGSRVVADLGLTGAPASAAANAIPTETSPVIGNGANLAYVDANWTTDYAGNKRPRSGSANTGAPWDVGPYVSAKTRQLVATTVIPASETDPIDVDKLVASAAYSISTYAVPIDISRGSGGTIYTGRLGGGRTLLLTMSPSAATTVKIVVGTLNVFPDDATAIGVLQDDSITHVFAADQTTTLRLQSRNKITQLSVVASAAATLHITVME